MVFFYLLFFTYNICLPLSVDTVIVDPISYRCHTDTTLEDVTLVGIPGQDGGCHETSIGPTPDSNPSIDTVRLVNKLSSCPPTWTCQ